MKYIWIHPVFHLFSEHQELPTFLNLMGQSISKITKKAYVSKPLLPILHSYLGDIFSDAA